MFCSCENHAKFVIVSDIVICVKVDIHIMKKPPSGEWTYLGTDVTDGNGRATYRIPDSDRLSQGMYPVKIIVRQVLYLFIDLFHV